MVKPINGFKWPPFLAMLLATLMAVATAGCASAQDEWQPKIDCLPADTSGVVEPGEPFAALPFAESLKNDIVISSGWETAADEVDIVRTCEHHAVDFEIAPGSSVKCQDIQVLAPANGWVTATYQAAVGVGAADADPPFNELHIDPYTGQTGWLGEAGLVAQIIFDVPELETPGAVGGSRPTFQMMHLGSVRPNIAWIPPVQQAPVKIVGGGEAATWTPVGLMRSQDKVIAGSDGYPAATYVNRGDPIGVMGRSGINFGQDDLFDPVNHTVTPQGAPWDPQGVGVVVPLDQACQMHLYAYTGRSEKGTKLGNFDPTGMYSQITGMPGTDGYNNPYHPSSGEWVMGPASAFEQYSDGSPVFAGK